MTPAIGSSPRVWGQAFLNAEGVSQLGIIPTRVGTSLWRLTAPLGVWDHPHACGDKTAFKATADLLKGSSPRVWGQVGATSRYDPSYRIIPTRVGTSIFEC